jgi:D-alanyl-D-alanine dipeptidase
MWKKVKMKKKFLKFCLFLILINFSIFYGENQTKLIDVKKVIPDIILEIRYATKNNFTGRVLYPSPDCFLAEEVAIALKKVNGDLKKMGYKLKIFDGYRPLSVQKVMWNVYPNPKYIANPKIGSVHNKGYAVDVSLVDINGKDIPMPTEFDEFSEKASPYYMNLPPNIIKNREILHNSMKKYGFIPSKTEWWHFNYQGHKNKPLIDIPFEKLKNKR